MDLVNRLGDTQRMEGELRVLYVRCLAAVKSTFCYILGRRDPVRLSGEPGLKHTHDFCFAYNPSAHSRQQRQVGRLLLLGIDADSGWPCSIKGESRCEAFLAGFLAAALWFRFCLDRMSQI